tara:strand:+ start:199 stop:360 length:162 start_codon:yes stop_codon:yes gene_type:complete
VEPETLVGRVAKVGAAKEHQILVEQALQLGNQIQAVELGAEAPLNLVDQVWLY